ncbi:hypothetical protein KVR01_007489 [Diaporthe batatas]|uniref:uncharacterized protein n=1 Tax=Diaporthe batatas TaxID=748121 RepID=UPI001D0493EB|nr:uncharacterized protein KVR01_007489 [Diaporthe batatas]KAG8163011.1 hypothetical protein KVR01_007489 [Diaporthe batatas]
MLRACAVRITLSSPKIQRIPSRPFSYSSMAQQKSQIIYAPSDQQPQGLKSVFLAGTTSKVDATDWRVTLSALLVEHPITIYNPYRPDWDSTWREDINFAPYRQQVEWELEKQEQADTVVVYFHPATQAPISLLELGLCARQPGKAVVFCPEGYWKRGNVQIVCQNFGIKMVDSIEELRDAIVKKLPSEPGQGVL